MAGAVGWQQKPPEQRRTHLLLSLAPWRLQLQRDALQQQPKAVKATGRPSCHCTDLQAMQDVKQLASKLFTQGSPLGE